MRQAIAYFGSMQIRVAGHCRALLLYALCALAGTAAAAPLQAQWSFRLLPGDPQLQAHPGLDAWRPARVPGSVHDDLYAAGVIGDPYVGAAEAGLQWIGLAAWEYRARFDVDAATLSRRHAELRFDGLDTFAEVSLNGQPLLKVDNAHRTWRARVDGRLRAADTTEVTMERRLALLSQTGLGAVAAADLVEFYDENQARGEGGKKGAEEAGRVRCVWHVTPPCHRQAGRRAGG